MGRTRIKTGVIQLKSASFFKFSTMRGRSYFVRLRKLSGRYVRIRFFSTFIEKSLLNSMSDVHDFLFTIFRSLLLSRFLFGSLNLQINIILELERLVYFWVLDRVSCVL